MLSVWLPDRSDCLVDVLDALDPLLEIWQAQKGCTDFQSIVALNFADHLDGVVSCPDWVNQLIDHRLQDRGFEAVLLDGPEDHLVLVGISSFLVHVGQHFQQGICQFWNVRDGELPVPQRLCPRQE